MTQNNEREDAYQHVLAYRQLGTGEHTMKPGATTCGCPQTYIDFYKIFVGFDGSHEAADNSGYQHMQSTDGTWYAIFDDD